MERALLVSIKIRPEKDNWHMEDIAEELEELARTAGIEVVDNVACVLDRPTANLFIGSGKAEELSFLASEENVDTLIFSHDFSGTQQRNLEDIIGRKTIDRTQLILDIFAHHAKSPEGKMQVELAQLEYLLPRLTGKGVILSRLGGGIGTSGPGESKLEMDRRRIRKKIDGLKEDLKHAASHRLTMAKKRKEQEVATAALVGYTNAGKSTLLNALTACGQAVSNGLFTTLDPLHKTLQLPNGENIVLCDTVGFLHQLPHHLIEAFKATLEEVVQADLLIHVLDAAHLRCRERAEAVFEVLKELRADNKPVITALNKIDLMSDKMLLEELKQAFPNTVAISAQSGQNLDLLQKKVQENFSCRMEQLEVMIPHSRMDLVGLFHREGKVNEIKYLQKGIRIKLTLPKVLVSKLLHNKDIEKLV